MSKRASDPKLASIKWVAILILLVLLARCGGEQIASILRPHADTVVNERTVVLPPDTVFVERIKAKVIRVPYVVLSESGDTLRIVDTVLTTPPFRAYVDTIIGCTQLKMTYKFPEHRFDSIFVQTCPDTLLVRDTTIVTQASNTFWQDVGTAAAGFVAGALVIASFVMGK